MFSYISPLSLQTATELSPEGQKVTFEVEPDPKDSSKLRAVNVVGE